MVKLGLQNGKLFRAWPLVQRRISRMRCLIVEDKPAPSRMLESYLSDFSDSSIAVSGDKAVQVFKDALEEAKPYDLILLDIRMPGMDGHETLRTIRQIEKEHGISSSDGVKVIMTTVKDDPENVIGAYRGSCEAYLVKPIRKKILLDEIRELGLIE